MTTCLVLIVCNRINVKNACKNLKTHVIIYLYSVCRCHSNERNWEKIQYALFLLEIYYRNHQLNQACLVVTALNQETVKNIHLHFESLSHH